MKSLIVLCLFGFSVGTSYLQKESIIPTERVNVKGLTGNELIGTGAKQALIALRKLLPKVDTGKLLEKRIDVDTLLAIAAGEVLVHEDEMIFSEAFNGRDLKTLGEIFGQLPNKDELIGTVVKEALKELDLKGAFPREYTEKLLEKGIDVETLLEEVLTGLEVENLVKKAFAGEDLKPLVEYDVERLLKTLEKVFGQEFINAVTKGDIVTVLHQETSPMIGPVFAYKLKLDNGIAETRYGSRGPNGTSIMKGSFTIPLDGGDVATFNWVADENGYRVDSPYLPTPPPAPPHVAELIRIAEEQRAAGVTFHSQEDWSH